MTGHIPGTTVLRGSKFAEKSPAGTNHVALRAANERLVLSLIRTHGSLSKAQLAELSGLTAQTASVISRSLIDAGLVRAGSPVRGKIGQPYVPLTLNPNGASFLGVHISKNEIRTAHVNFVGEIIAETVAPVDSPGGELIASHVLETAEAVRKNSDSDQRYRFQAVGVSIASDLATSHGAATWSTTDSLLQDVSRSLGLPVTLSTATMAACSAELIYGIGPTVSDFLYVFLDASVSGGLVQGRRVRFAGGNTLPILGQLLVPSGKLQPVPLHSLAVNADSDANAIARLAEGIAFAVLSCAALVPCRTVIVDSPLPAHTLRLVMAKLRSAIAQLGASVGAEISAREGSMIRKPIAMGAACLPLLDRYYPEE